MLLCISYIRTHVYLIVCTVGSEAKPFTINTHCGALQSHNDIALLGYYKPNYTHKTWL